MCVRERGAGALSAVASAALQTNGAGLFLWQLVGESSDVDVFPGDAAPADGHHFHLSPLAEVREAHETVRTSRRALSGRHLKLSTRCATDFWLAAALCIQELYRWNNYGDHVVQEDERRLASTVELAQSEAEEERTWALNDGDRFGLTLEEGEYDDDDEIEGLGPLALATGRKYKQLRKQVADNQFLFTNPIFSVEPLCGELWPNSSVELVVTFATAGGG